MLELWAREGVPLGYARLADGSVLEAAVESGCVKEVDWCMRHRGRGAHEAVDLAALLGRIRC